LFVFGFPLAIAPSPTIRAVATQFPFPVLTASLIFCPRLLSGDFPIAKLSGTASASQSGKDAPKVNERLATHDL
jgi:hypothetical protein